MAAASSAGQKKNTTHDSAQSSCNVTATMRLLIFQGGSGNFGDTAMLEGVVLNLHRNLPTAELFVADRPGLRTNIWHLPRVHKQLIPQPIFPLEYALARVH